MSWKSDFIPDSYVIFKLGLSGPLLHLATTVTNEVSISFVSQDCNSRLMRSFYQVQKQATERLKEHFAAPVLNQPSRNGTSVNYDDDDRNDIELRKFQDAQ